MLPFEHVFKFVHKSDVEIDKCRPEFTSTCLNVKWTSLSGVQAYLHVKREAELQTEFYIDQC